MQNICQVCKAAGAAEPPQHQVQIQVQAEVKPAVAWTPFLNQNVWSHGFVKRTLSLHCGISTFKTSLNCYHFVKVERRGSSGSIWGRGGLQKLGLLLHPFSFETKSKNIVLLTKHSVQPKNMKAKGLGNTYTLWWMTLLLPWWWDQ